MHFKLDVVGPRSPADQVWRSVAGRDRFLAFLSFFAELDIKSAIACAYAIAPETTNVLRFEDLVSGLLPPRTIGEFNAIEPGLGTQFAEALPLAVGAPTSTLSKRHADYREHWSEAAQAFYIESGLRDANRAIGYDLP
jgi:hypothetical protein